MHNDGTWGKKNVRLQKMVKKLSTPRPPLKRPSHMLVTHSKQKIAIFRKFPKVICDICATNTLVEGGKILVFCKNCDHEMFL